MNNVEEQAMDAFVAIGLAALVGILIGSGLGFISLMILP